MSPLFKIVIYWILALSLAIAIMAYTTARAEIGWYGLGGGFLCTVDEGSPPYPDRWDRDLMAEYCEANGALYMRQTLANYAGWYGTAPDPDPLPPFPPESTREPEVIDQLLDDGYACRLFPGPLPPPPVREIPAHVNRWDKPAVESWCASNLSSQVPALGVYRVLRIYFATEDTHLTWTPPTLNEDGTPLTDLAGYKIYYGQNPFLLTKEIEVNDPFDNSASSEIGVGKWYFEATAVDTSDNESRRSNQAHKEFLP